MHTAYTARTTVGICQFVNGIYEQHFRTAVPVRAPTNIRGVYMDKKTNIKDIISMAGGLDYINPKDIPSIDLYMDQLTTFMEDQLGKNRRNDEDKVMTKTMINNYTKNNLLPSPNKKRYSKQHLILLIYIYYLKNMLSINDIQTLLEPLIDGYFDSNKDGKDISDIYAHLYEHLSQHYGDIIKDIVRTANKADAMYDPEKDSYLHDLSMISLLSVDIYAKKKYVEHLVDKLRQESEEDAKAKAKAQAQKAREQAAAKPQRLSSHRQTPQPRARKNSQLTHNQQVLRPDFTGLQPVTQIKPLNDKI